MKNSTPKFDELIEFSKFLPNAESNIIKDKFGFIKETYEISTPAQSKTYHKPIGKYTLLTLPKILQPSPDAEKFYNKKLCETLKDYLSDLNNNTTILVVGLGNRHISSDSLGTEVVKNIEITRGFSDKTPKLCAFAPSVLGLTGIETADTIKGLTNQIKPDIIIMIDSLCASHPSRLGVSFQITDTPIIPGSGVNNTRKKLSTKIKTISIGVPLVIYGDTFIKSAIAPENSLKNKNKTPSHEMLVTLNEIDYHARYIGSFIAKAINTVVLSK